MLFPRCAWHFAGSKQRNAERASVTVAGELRGTRTISPLDVRTIRSAASSPHHAMTRAEVLLMTFPNVVFIRHKVMNFRKWKAVFEAHSAARVALGCQGAHIFRRADNPKELVVMLTWSDLAKARQFLVSEDLKAMLAEVPVGDRAPDIFLLEEVEETYLATLRDSASITNGAPSRPAPDGMVASARSAALERADELAGRASFASPAWFR